MLNIFNHCDLATVISQIETPFAIIGNNYDSRTFSKNTFLNATLYVPAGTLSQYEMTDGWKDFLFKEEGSGPGGGGGGGTQKCEKPTISYSNAKLTFHSSTSGASYQYAITDADIKSGGGSEVQLGVTYNISVYATKAGFENSETAYATLCWVEVEPQKEGITDGVANVPAQALLIQSNGGQLTIQGVDDGKQVSVYNINGTEAGKAISMNGCATVNTNLQAGSVAIIKIGEKSVKVVVK